MMKSIGNVMKKVALPLAMAGVAVLSAPFAFAQKATAMNLRTFEQYTPRIIDGKPAVEGNYPFMTSLI